MVRVCRNDERIIIKGLQVEDFINYKKPSMTIMLPFCTFKCEKECKIPGMCQNSKLAKIKNISVSIFDILDKYIKNPITSAIVMSGLEPMDSFLDIKKIIELFRKHVDDDIVIYTGYTEKEIDKQIKELQVFKNIIIKVGRYLPNQNVHFDELLGVNLASDNQYAIKIS